MFSAPRDYSVVRPALRSRCRLLAALLLSSLPVLAGCAMNSRAENGALLGGLGGAGLGAIAGHQVGHTGAGAAIGALAGAVTGTVVGDQIDQVEARNRAEIEARLGRPVAAGAVSIENVVEMTQRGVHEDVIAQHVRAHGMTRPLTTDDLIRLTNSQVSDRVIRAMQEQPAPRYVQPAAYVAPAPPPVIVERYYDPYPPYCGPYYHRRHHHHHHPGYSVGFSFSD